MAATPYTAVPTATQAPGPQPAPNALPIINIPAGSDAPTIESITQAFKELTDWVGYLNQQPKFIPCDGSDGNVTLDGVVAAPPWASKVGTVYTLTRDTALNNLTVTGAGVVLQTANFRLIGSGTLTTAAGGIVKNVGGAGGNGSNTTAGLAGVAVASGSLGVGSNGGLGGQSSSGSPGANITGALGGVGGVGGSSGGAAGTVTAPAANLGLARFVSTPTAGYIFSYANPGVWTQLQGGSGGGGGAAAGPTSGGGGGGAGAGVMVVIFRNIQLANVTDIQCIGGAGGNAFNIGGGQGGGGGGGGGLLILVYGNANQTFSAANNCPGGAGGLLGGSGTNGANGAVGTFVNGSLA